MEENGFFSAANPQSSNLLSVQPGVLFVNALKNQQAKIENQGNLITGKHLTFFSSNINSSGILSAPHGKIELTSTVGDIQVSELTAKAATLTANQNINYGNISLVLDDNTADSSINPTLSLIAGKQIISTGNITTTAQGLLVNLQAKDNINIKEISSKGGDINLTSEGGDISTGKLDTTYATPPQTTVIDVDLGGTFTVNPDEYIYGGNFTFNSNLTDPITEVKVRLSASNIISNSWVSLSSPTEFVYLIDSTGNNLANFQDTLLADSASTPISSGSTPFNGTFQASEPLANLNRLTPNGTWSLYINNNNNPANTTTTVYKAGDTTPWGIATGTQLIITTSRSLAAGGNVNLKAGGKISTGNINSSSSINAGLIALNANHDISTGNINSDSIFGNGGNIAITTTQGNISTQSLDSSSVSESGRGGNGGKISLTAGGNISTQYLDSSSFSDSGRGGNGGEMTLTAGGNISTQSLDSRSYLPSGTGGNGGKISLTAGGDISTQTLDSYSLTVSGRGGNGGRISLTAGGNISTQYLDSGSYLLSGTGGNGGRISLTAGGDISTLSLYSVSYSDSGTGGNGGRISLTAGGDISTLSLESSSLSVFDGTAGNGGAINLSARDGNINGSSLNSFSLAQTGKAGTGGNVTLEAKNSVTGLQISTLSSDSKSGTVQLRGFGDLSLTDTNILTSKQVISVFPHFGEIGIDVSGVGQSGDVNVSSLGNLTFNNSRIESDTKGSDPAGNVTIASPGTVIFNNNSKIISSTSSTGNAGNIQINANNLNLTDASEISASTTADGKAGDITLNTPTLTVANGGKIFATTTGKGDGGTITINAPDTVNLGIGVQDFAPILSVETTGAGKAGNIIVNTPSLTVSDTARITATATETATNKDGGGSITLNASKMNLAGIVGVFAETQGEAPAGTLKLSPYQNQPDLDITLFPNSTISASTTASGNGGDLIITAPQNINIAGKGKLAVESTGSGAAGNIQITTQNLNITDGVKISASTTFTIYSYSCTVFND